ncbi:DUF2069 domain-containing protein [Ketobacter sp.]|uniref:DUF2069 domain-containing protein n=1 Tax=Ketobacter sp. TaxID=2083498 RepID=UPI000F13518B|nr:DUF2069 domain-containing protein [Ketobacter sp.]RLU01521.1 MAG: DUF2069 domain-containing protein [Ketobacter sp.]
MTELLTKRAEFCRTLTLGLLAALLLLFVAWRVIFIPVEHWITILLIHMIPLILFIPGMLARKPKVFIWFCFVILLYFCQGVMSSFALPTILGVMGLLETILTIGAFCAAMMAARYYARLENIS